MTDPTSYNHHGTLPLFTQEITSNGSLSMTFRVPAGVSGSEPLGDGLVMDYFPQGNDFVSVYVKNFVPFPQPFFHESLADHFNVIPNPASYNRHGMSSEFSIQPEHNGTLSLYLRVSTLMSGRSYFKGGLVMEYYPAGNAEKSQSISASLARS